MYAEHRLNTTGAVLQRKASAEPFFFCYRSQLIRESMNELKSEGKPRSRCISPQTQHNIEFEFFLHSVVFTISLV